MGRTPLTLIIAACLIVGGLIAPQRSAWAWPPTFGSEFNFSDQDLDQAWNIRKGVSRRQPGLEERAAAEKFAEAVKLSCDKDCVVTPHIGKFGATEYRVTFEDGYNFNISVDPAVVEIQTVPETTDQLRSRESRSQAFIFDVAERLGLQAELVKQTAHFNVGLLSAFEGDPKGFLRFFVNYHNFSELASGALGEDYGNAPPVSHLAPRQRAALSKIVEAVNSGQIERVEDVATQIQRKVYTKTPTFNLGYHYQGISVKYIHPQMTLAEDRPFELRAPRQPRNSHERTLLAELLEKRMEFEKRSTEPIVFLDRSKEFFYLPNQLSNSFRLYLAEMGADWNYFKVLLPEDLQDLPEDAFLSGKVQWSSAQDIATLKYYTTFLANSKWVRDRMLAILTSPEGLASHDLPYILEEAKAKMGRHANRSAIQVRNKFIEAVTGKPVEEETPGFLKRILLFCQRLLTGG